MLDFKSAILDWRRTGKRDLMIGATAIARNFSLLTRDKRTFSRIPGLKVQLI
jgi:predicted nucleic acid-binding protein